MQNLTFDELVRALSNPEAYPEPTQSVECVQTHISAVFLTPDAAYKLKKPKDVGFVDFTSLEARRYFCHEEIRLNRRLAPAVYQGVVPIVDDGGRIRVSARFQSMDEAPPPGLVDWAVRMVRLPETRRLDVLLDAGDVGVIEIQNLARHLAEFHASAARGDRISSVASWSTIHGNHLENLELIQPFEGATLSARVLDRLTVLISSELLARREIIEGRTRRGVPRDTHGDLRLEHIYLLPPGARGRSDLGMAKAETQPAIEIVIIDCIEFNERFRWADPVADIAFLVMELEYTGQFDLAREFAHRYLEAAGDSEGAALLPYFVTYRDLVRGLVRSLQSVDRSVEPARREAAAERASRHFIRALSRLSPPGRRPGLVILQGLPGIGKSSLARGLERTEGFRWIDTDVVRKEMTKELPRSERDLVLSAGGGFAAGIYSTQWSDRTYEECGRRARKILWEGGRALVEGSFRREDHRVALLDIALRLGVSGVILDCSLDEDEARRRIDARTSGPSDANWSVHVRMAADWQDPGAASAAWLKPLSLSGTEEATLSRARIILHEVGLSER